ncbi:MAG: Tex-like N-terminal domain-containing protein, partial [Gemmataceae bacterium]
MSTTTMPQSSEQQAPPAPRPELGHLDLSRIAQDLQIRKLQVEAVVQLLDDGNTIPFITRYRKERTGGLDEEVLRTIQERIGLLRALADRKQTILRTIDSQGKLTDELKAAILAADNPKRLEDLYLPYKPKKRSLAQAARDKGLERLALAIWEADPVAADLPGLLPTLINPEQGLTNEEEILLGAGHILAELIAEAADVRAIVRAVMWDTGKVLTTKSEKLAEGQGQEFRDYFAFNEALRQIPPHRVLAINRGEKDGALTVKIDWDAATGRRVAAERLPLPKKEEPRPAEAPAPVAEAPSADGAAPGPHGPHHHPPRGHRGPPPFVSRLPDLERHPHREFLERCLDDAMGRLLVPSLEREIRRELTQRAENHAVVVFARNLRSKLLAAPLRGKRVLAVDPAFRTGCKVAALNEQGDLVADAVIFPHPPQNKRAEAKAKLEELIRRNQVNVIAIGNGTACRETEELVSDLLTEFEARRNNPTPPPIEAPAPEPAAEAAPPPALVIETPHEAPPAPAGEVAQLPQEPPPLPPEVTGEQPVAQAPPPPPPPPPRPPAPP